MLYFPWLSLFGLLVWICVGVWLDGVGVVYGLIFGLVVVCCVCRLGLFSWVIFMFKFGVVGSCLVWCVCHNAVGVVGARVCVCVSFVVWELVGCVIWLANFGFCGLCYNVCELKGSCLIAGLYVWILESLGLLWLLWDGLLWLCGLFSCFYGCLYVGYLFACVWLVIGVYWIVPLDARFLLLELRRVLVSVCFVGFYFCYGSNYCALNVGMLGFVGLYWFDCCGVGWGGCGVCLWCLDLWLFDCVTVSYLLLGCAFTL